LFDLVVQWKGVCTPHSGHFKIAPPLLENEESEEPDLRRMAIDGVVGKFRDLLQEEKIGTDIFVGDLLRQITKGS